MASDITPNAALRDAIFRTGTSQTLIARRAGINESRLSRIVRGWVEANDDERQRIAKALRVSVDDIFREQVA